MAVEASRYVKDGVGKMDLPILLAIWASDRLLNIPLIELTTIWVTSRVIVGGQAEQSRVETPVVTGILPLIWMVSLLRRRWLNGQSLVVLENLPFTQGLRMVWSPKWQCSNQFVADEL